MEHLLSPWRTPHLPCCCLCRCFPLLVLWWCFYLHSLLFSITTFTYTRISVFTILPVLHFEFPLLFITLLSTTLFSLRSLLLFLTLPWLFSFLYVLVVFTITLRLAYFGLPWDSSMITLVFYFTFISFPWWVYIITFSILTLHLVWW